MYVCRCVHKLIYGCIRFKCKKLVISALRRVWNAYFFGLHLSRYNFQRWLVLWYSPVHRNTVYLKMTACQLASVRTRKIAPDVLHKTLALALDRFIHPFSSSSILGACLRSVWSASGYWPYLLYINKIIYYLKNDCIPVINNLYKLQLPARDKFW